MSATLSKLMSVFAALAFVTLSLALYGGRDAETLDFLKMGLFGSILGWSVWSRGKEFL